MSLYDFFKYTARHTLSISNEDMEFKDIFKFDNAFGYDENSKPYEIFMNKWFHPEKWEGLSINIDKNYQITNINNFFEDNPFNSSIRF